MIAELTPRQRWILLAASLAVGLAFLDETAVVTALRAIQHDFNASNTEVQWVIGAYLLALASLMAAAGRLADMYGRRRLFIIGAAVFGIGSIAAAASPTEEVLIAARAVQGCGGALVMPLGIANATASVSEDHRGWVIGIISTGATVFLAVGPVVGGGLVVVAGWRWIFLINLPAVVAILAISVWQLPETRGDSSQALDYRGMALLVGGLCALVLGLLNVRDWGPAAPGTIALLAASVVLLVAFAAVEHAAAEPLIDLRLLRIPAVAGCLCALFAIQFSILGLTVNVTLYLQRVLGYSPASAGALVLPTVVLAPLVTPWVGRLVDRFGPRWPTVGAMALAAVAVATVGVLAERRDVLLLLPAFLVFGLARPISTVAATTGTVGAIPRKLRGLSSALVTEARQLGAVLGVAVLGLVLTGLETIRRNDLLTGIDSSFGHAQREALDGILAGSRQSNALLAPLSPSARHAAHEAAATAFISGFRVAMLAVAGIAALAAVISALLLREHKPAIFRPERTAVAAAAGVAHGPHEPIAEP